MTYFETIKCFDEEVFYLEYHQKRIAKTVGLNINLQEYIYPPSAKLLKCKVIYNEDGIIDIVYDEYAAREIKTFKFIFNDDIVYRYKSTIREDIDNLFNQKDNKDEVIIVKNGLITDTSIANIAIYDGINWITPRLPLLEGTTRSRLIDNKILIQKDITVKEFMKAKKIALMNAMVEFKIISNFQEIGEIVSI